MDFNRNYHQEPVRVILLKLSTASIALFLWLQIAASTMRASAGAVAEEQAKPVVYSKDVSIDELSSAFDKRLLPTMGKAEARGILAKQPSLILDGAKLYLTPPKVGFGRSLAVKDLVLRNGGQIVTNGVDLEIDSISIMSDKGEVISFTDDKKSSGVAPVGNNGNPGLNAGTVILNGALAKNNILIVYLRGQDGQKGGSGVPGAGGPQGPRGSNAADHLFDCGSSGGDGGVGGRGGDGGNGGSGGSGGNGGRLILRGDLARQRAQIDFRAPGGMGGPGGDSGTAGPGGPGGEGGSGSSHCGGGHGGPSGPPGQPGGGGAAGVPGKSGALSAE
jgi:hypothetical protein